MSQALSLKPDDMSTGGGGILADTNIRINKARFGMEDYSGKMTAVPALKIDYTDLDRDEDFNQSWSVGSSQDYTPSKNGKQLNGTKPIRANSNFGMFMASIANAIGSDEFNEHIGDDISVLEDMECHVFQQIDERPTAKPKRGKDGKEYPATIPLIDKVMVKPWDKGKGKAATSTGDDDNKTAAAVMVKAALADTDGLSRADLAVKVFQSNMDNPDITPIVALISNNKAFVDAIDGVTSEGDMYKLG